MKDDVLIKVDNVSKKFCRSLKKSLWYGMQDLGREITGRRHGGDGELRPEEFWAVKDVSFELKRGECLGLIGHNGAGKTTLLRMLNGLIKPDHGRIEMRGRVGALIALGAGFNPILTGRENIYVNASVLGVSKRELDEKIEEIIDFAEIGEFIDAPVQSYSSGMQVRLGFSVASSLEPDILILDEVLAVGDAGFRTKCYNRIRKISEKSAVIFVTHSMPYVARMCNLSLFLEKGMPSGLLPAQDGISNYEKSVMKDNVVEGRLGSGEAAILSIKVNNYKICLLKKSTINVAYGEALGFDLYIESNLSSFFVIDLTFHSKSGEAIAECNNFVRENLIYLSANEKKKIKISINEFSLNPGIYNVSLLIMSENMTAHYDWLQNFCELIVKGKPAFAGQQFLADWKVDN